MDFDVPDGNLVLLCIFINAWAISCRRDHDSMRTIVNGIKESAEAVDCRHTDWAVQILNLNNFSIEPATELKFPVNVSSALHRFTRYCTDGVQLNIPLKGEQFETGIRWTWQFGQTLNDVIDEKVFVGSFGGFMFHSLLKLRGLFTVLRCPLALIDLVHNILPYDTDTETFSTASVGLPEHPPAQISRVDRPRKNADLQTGPNVVTVPRTAP